MSATAIYEGKVRHRRMAPFEHEFEYPLFMTLVDLDELPSAFDRIPGWSARRPALARFRRADYLGPADRPLDECVRDRVGELTGRRPAGPIRLLTNLRCFGHCFNPVSFYFCFDERGERVDQVLAEVTNTPWGERHVYVIGTPGDAEQGTSNGPVITGRIAKAFHVSPLMGMDHTYEWRTTEPGDGVSVHIDSKRGGEVAFDATLSLRRRELTPAAGMRVLARYPAISLQTLAKIYWQATRLKLKGARYFPHPGRTRAKEAAG
jgi:DUF1365 family protein